MDFQLSALPSAPRVTLGALPGPINVLIRAQQLQRFLSLLHESSACVAVSLWQDSSLCKENAKSVLLEGTRGVHPCPALAWDLKRRLGAFFGWICQGIVILGVPGVWLGCSRAAGRGWMIRRELK